MQKIQKCVGIIVVALVILLGRLPYGFGCQPVEAATDGITSRLNELVQVMMAILF